MRQGESLLYEPEERPPLLVSIGVGIQGVTLVLVSIGSLVVITALASGQGHEYRHWATFSSLIICGGVTALQSCRIWRVGNGHIGMTAPAAAFVAVAVAALKAGGPPMLASVTVVAALFQFALVSWLPLLRRIITPTVTGVALILLAVTVVPLAVDQLNDAPPGVSAVAAPLAGAATLAAVAVATLLAKGTWRLWAPVMGILPGCAVAAAFGLYNIDRVIDDAWVGFPRGGLPGFDLSLGAGFWGVLPLALVVTLVNTAKNFGDVIVVHRVSRRRPQATDFRLVQGALNANSLSILLCGVAATIPTGVISNTPTFITITGVAARAVGYVMGAMLVALAFSPKFTAVLLTIPGPVMGAYQAVMMSMVAVEGMRTVVQEGLNQQKVIVVAVAFAVGLSVEVSDALAELTQGTWAAFLGNGITAGTLAAMLLTWFVDLTGARRRRLRVALDTSALPEIDAFLRGIASRTSWNAASTERLCAAGEETLSSLLQLADDDPSVSGRGLVIIAQPGDGVMELEFVATFDEENLEDRLTYLNEQTETPSEYEISFRLLRHYAAAVRHQKYHGMDVVRVQVEGSR